jgi:hypothetical protein
MPDFSTSSMIANVTQYWGLLYRHLIVLDQLIDQLPPGGITLGIIGMS